MQLAAAATVSVTMETMLYVGYVTDTASVSGVVTSAMTSSLTTLRLVVLLYLLDLGGRSCCAATHQRFYGRPT